MRYILSFLKLIEHNFGVVLLISTILAFLFPQWFLWAVENADIFLMLALFFGCLKIDFSELIHLKSNLPKLFMFIAFNLIVYPSIFYAVSFYIPQDIRVGVFLVMGISGAVMTPLLASLMNLKILWAVSYVVFSSLLVPFTMPLLVNLFFGIQLNVSFLNMSLFLMKIIFIPVFSAIGLRLIWQRFVIKVTQFTGSFGTITISLFLAIIIAKHQTTLLESFFKIETLWIVFLLIFVYFVRFFVGWIAPWTDKKERWTNAMMFGNLNTGLAIIIAAEYFNPMVLLVVLLGEIPYVLSQPIFQKIYYTFQNK